MLQYLVRFCKYVIYCSLLFSLLLIMVFYTSNHGELTYFWELIHPSKYLQVALLVVVYAAVYPFIGYVDRKVYLNQPFQKDREALIHGILHAQFLIVSDSGTVLVFRPKSKFTRLMRLYEDKIVLDYSNNPILLYGMRRDVQRFARNMEYVVRQLARDDHP